MTKTEACESAKEISRQYGETCVFKEPGKLVSYQAIAGIPPIGSIIVAFAEDGKIIRVITGSFD